VTRPSGARRIFAYNWPTYAATWAVSSVLLAVALARPRVALLALLAGAIPLVWSVASLLVSFYVYDRSPLVAGRWVRQLLPASVHDWAAVHAGLDAEVDLDAVMPGACAARLDIFDAGSMTAPSIARARAQTARERPATPCPPVALALADQAYDAIVVAFTAHEIRDRGARERFFAELHRALRPGGRVVLVEHPRDVMNFLAFGPGWLHFVSRREWLRLAAGAELGIAVERRVTPWVMALGLERAP
jgi:hypothetical protein